MKGIVKWFNNEKGYGFITNDEGKDIFVHYTGIESKGFKTLKDGDNVEFDINKVEKGLQAFNVKAIEKTND